MRGYGRGVGISHLDVQAPRQLITLEYSIASEDEDAAGSGSTPRPQMQGFDDLQALKESRRLERSVEFTLPSAHSWDVRVHTRASSSTVLAPHYVVQASQPAGSFATSFDEPITLRISHPSPPDHTVLKAAVSLEPAASLSVNGRTLRINGTVQNVPRIEPRDPTPLPNFSSSASRQLLEQASTLGEVISLGGESSTSTPSESTAFPSSTYSKPPARTKSNHSISSVQTERTAPGGLSGSGRGGRPGILGVPPLRTHAAEKAIMNLIRRNYIYFTSLLQEPEAKWSKTITESKGVTVTQLNSIDPTLVVYRAEAVFVGVGVWDLLSIVATPGVASYWNKGFEDAGYLDHVSELTDLWHLKTRAAWPVK